MAMRLNPEGWKQVDAKMWRNMQVYAQSSDAALREANREQWRYNYAFPSQYGSLGRYGL